jgi:predicted DNA-binding ribbon-helix-helix protein
VEGRRPREIQMRDTKHRSIAIAGHKTSVTVEDGFWNGLKDIAAERNVTVPELIAAIDGDRQHANLSSAIRLFVLGFYRNKPSQQDSCRKPRHVLAS